MTEKTWIESRLRDYQPQIDNAARQLGRLGRKEHHSADDPLDVDRETFVAVLLVNLLRYCYRVACETDWHPAVEKRESTNLKRNAENARALAIFIRRYESQRGGLFLGCSSIEEDDEEPLGLSGSQLAGTIEIFARQLEEEANREKNRTTFSHVAYGSPPGRGARPDFKTWRLVGELTALFLQLFGNRRPSLTAIFSEITFDKPEFKEGILEVLRRMNERGVIITTLPNVPVRNPARGGPIPKK